MNNLNNILDYLKVFNNIDKNPEPRFMAQGGRPGYKRGSTIAMQKPVEFYVDIVRNMIQDTTYTPPVNINAREVGTIPNFQKAKELVKADVGESFDVLYNRNVQKRKKIKRAEDPIKKEKDLISKAERKSKRRVLKADPSDPVKMTDREQALNFEQRKHNRDLNLKIRQNPDLILKDKSLMDKLSTTVSKDGNIIKVKPTLDDIKNRGIVEVEHQRDIFKKGKLKDLPYNRNFILGPYNREGGFKKMAETFIEKNPDANNIKVKNIIKKAKELGVTLQPNVPKGTFPTKGIGYKQVGGPVEKFANAAAHSLQGSKLNLSSKKPVRSFLGKTFRTLGTPLSGLGFAGWTAYDNLKAGKGLTDSVVDPLVGGELLFPSLFVENVAKITKSPTLQKILGLGKFGSRVMPVTGTAITLAGLTKDATQEIMNESRRIDAIENSDQQLAEQDMLVRNIKGYADGGRISFGKGKLAIKGIDKGRRAFIKLLTALGIGTATVGTGLLKLSGKAATKTAVKAGVDIATNTPGMPSWFAPLVNKIIKEGDDVTKKLGTVEREVVHTKKIDTGSASPDEVTVYQNLDTGDIRVEVDSVSNMGEAPIQLDYKASSVIDEGKMAGQKTKPEFSAVESEPRVVNFDGDIEFDGENIVGSVDDLFSDTTRVKNYAKGEKPTMQDIVTRKKKTDIVEEIHERPGEHINNKYGDGPDYDDYASGGRVSYFDGGIVSLKKKW